MTSSVRFIEDVWKRLTTPSSATPGRGRGCEHSGARRRRGLCRASWGAAQPATEPVGPKPPPGNGTPKPGVRWGAGLGVRSDARVTSNKNLERRGLVDDG